MLALAWQRRPRFQKDRQQQSLLLWGTWVLTMGTFFSVAGFFQQYYMTTFAPAICALFGIGVTVMWQDYRRADWRGWLLPLALVLTAMEQIHFIISNPSWGIWLIPVIGITCLLTALILSLARLYMQFTLSPRVLMPVLACGLAALLLTPAIWSAMPALQNIAPRAPSAGPTRQNHFLAFANNDTANPALIRYLETNRANSTYLVATPSSMSADAFILATNQPAMALGGFSGRDPILTTEQLNTLITHKTVRFFWLNNPSHQTRLASRSHAARADQQARAILPWFGRNSQTTLTTWVTQHCAPVPVSQWQTPSANSVNSPMLLYDCAPGK